MARNELGAIVALVAFVLGIYFAIPSQANIGYMIIDALGSSGVNTINTTVFKGMFSFLAVVIVIVDIAYIVEQFKKGNF